MKLRMVMVCVKERAAGCSLLCFQHYSWTQVGTLLFSSLASSCVEELNSSCLSSCSWGDMHMFTHPFGAIAVNNQQAAGTKRQPLCGNEFTPLLHHAFVGHECELCTSFPASCCLGGTKLIVVDEASKKGLPWWLRW